MKKISREEIRKEGFPPPVVLNTKKIQDDDFKILAELARLTESEKEIRDRINNTQPKSGIFFDGAATLCQDKDDWRVITAKDREELKKIKKEIKTALNKALDKGLGCLGLIQRGCREYGIKP